MVYAWVNIRPLSETLRSIAPPSFLRDRAFLPASISAYTCETGDTLGDKQRPGGTSCTQACQWEVSGGNSWQCARRTLGLWRDSTDMDLKGLAERSRNCFCLQLATSLLSIDAWKMKIFSKCLLMVNSRKLSGFFNCWFVSFCFPFTSWLDSGTQQRLVKFGNLKPVC